MTPSEIFSLLRRGALAATVITGLMNPARADDLLRQKIGQMILVGFIGPTVSDSLAADLSARNLGGVLLSGANGNLNSPAQIQQLTAQIRSVARSGPFLAADQEGGLVARLNSSNGFASTYSAYKLGTVFASLDSTRKQSSSMASWMSSCGMNLDFAPVADVNVNPSSPAIGYYGRSFSADPHTVALHDGAFIDAFHARGVMTALKHFPGHGSAATDSHLTLPDITATWSAAELTPYRELLAAGSIDMVMIGHLYNAKIDSVYPSSLSKSTIQTLLRDSLGYNGVVITDDLYGMKAITANYGFWDAAELSIRAGTDILLYASNTYNGSSLCRQLVDTLEARVLRGVIPPARIDESYARIMQLKAAYLTTGVKGSVASGDAAPKAFTLANYPNPFNPLTTIRFDLPIAGKVSIRIYDLLGREADVLVEGFQAAGRYEARWNASRFASGVYFCRFASGNHVETVRLILMR